jgi:hypothetical protein
MMFCYIPGWGTRVLVNGKPHDFLLQGKRCDFDLRNSETVDEEKNMWEKNK